MAIPMSLLKEEEHVRKILPLLLKKDTQFRREIYVILTETFPTREELKQILDELRIFRKESNERFEAIDKRFEAVDKRFEEMNKRFEAVDKRFEEMNKRFEAVDKRFEEMNKRFEEMNERLDNQMAWVGTVVGGLQRRAGRNLEDTIAGTLRFVLRRKDIKPESLKLRQKIEDEEGIIGPKGREYEIDMWLHNSETILFEIKSYAEPEDVLRFNDKAELYSQKKGISNPLKAFITLDKSRDMISICEKVGVELV